MTYYKLSSQRAFTAKNTAQKHSIAFWPYMFALQNYSPQLAFTSLFATLQQCWIEKNAKQLSSIIRLICCSILVFYNTGTNYTYF